MLLVPHQTLIRCGLIVPVIFVSSTPDIPFAVAAFKQGAQDFLINPEPTTLQTAIKRVLTSIPACQYRLNQLSPRETEVLRFFVKGCNAATVAEKLGISRKTIDVHRSRVLCKLQIRSINALMYQLSKANLFQKLANA